MPHLDKATGVVHTKVRMPRMLCLLSGFPVLYNLWVTVLSHRAEKDRAPERRRRAEKRLLSTSQCARAACETLPAALLQMLCLAQSGSFY